MDSQGNLYGTTVNGPGCTPKPCKVSSGMVYEITPTAETVLHSFKASTDGAFPYAGVLMSPSGVFHGTASTGGTANMGVVFEMSTTAEKVLHSFTGPPLDGAFPYAGLVEDSSGNVYGTTSAGGSSNNGTVFKITPSGTETILHSFQGGTDGAVPYGGLLLSSAGNLYGVTTAGGVATGNCFPSGCGVIFMVTPAGRESVLYRFTGSPDGASPYGGLIVDASANLYGTTYNGGTGACTNGCGVIFELTKAGTESVLYSFQGYPSDGAFPYAGLVRNSTTGDFYGTTVYGGSSENGTVFELDAAGVESVLYNFTGGTDGGVPRAPLVMNSAGLLFGTTYSGGVSGVQCGGSPSDSCGVLFKLQP